MAVYADGHILFTREGTLLAQSFDSRRLVTDGDPVVIATDITVQGNRAAMFSVSRSGLLVVRSASLPPTQLTVVDRGGGRRLRTVGEPADMTEVALSPDDTRAVVSIRDPSKQTRDLWVQDLVRDVRTRLTFDPGDDQQPAWSPDGTRVLFSAARPARLDLYERMTDGSGSERQVFAFDSLRLNSYATSWSPDSRYILFYNGTVESPTGSNDIQVLATSGERAPRPFLQTRFSEEDGQFSPDGRWIAYKSNESGRYEVYVVPFPGPAGKWKVSTAGGETPRWRRDGKELFFLSGTAMVSANVNGSGNTFAVGRSQRLFDAHLGDRDNVEHSYGVFADGQRFLIALVAADQPAEAPIRVITNWTSLLQKTK